MLKSELMQWGSLESSQGLEEFDIFSDLAHVFFAGQVDTH
jgi:hypothetical protein